jgi:hypothetical protein
MRAILFGWTLAECLREKVLLVEYSGVGVLVYGSLPLGCAVSLRQERSVYSTRSS